MEKLTKSIMGKHHWFATTALVVAFVALVVAAAAWIASNRGPAPPVERSHSRWATMKQNGVMRVGYGGWSPYTIINITGEADEPVTGFAVDLINEIAQRYDPPLRIEWRQFSWDTLRADVATDKFDFIADPVFQTIPRAADFVLCEPYSYFGIAAALVRHNDDRFHAFEDLDQEGITIALAEGWTSSEFARAHLSKPTFRAIPVTGDAFNQLDEVLMGRADVALNDVQTVLQYARAHSGEVKALWIDDPPSQVPGSFLVRRGDAELRDFLNTAIRIMQADGTLRRLDRKWNSAGFIPELVLQPGAGLGDQADPSDG